MGTSLVVQRLLFHASTAEGTGNSSQFLVGKLRSSMLQCQKIKFKKKKNSAPILPKIYILLN